MRLSVFRKMVEDSYNVLYTPSPAQVRKFFELSEKIAEESVSEQEWYQKITEAALHWLEIR